MSGATARPTPPPDSARSRVNASAQLIQVWFKRADTIATAPGGRFELTAAQRKLVLLFLDGTLLIDRNNVQNPQVLAMREVARRKGILIRSVYQVEIGLIRELYEEAERLRREAAGGAHADLDAMPMQRALLGLLEEAVAVQASDVHVYVGAHEAQIKLRVRGEMRVLRQVNAQYGHEMLAAAYNMAESSDATYRLYDYQAARISAGKTPLPGGLQTVRLQLNPMGSGGRYLIARLLYAENRWAERVTLESLGLHPQQLRALAHMRKVPEGVNIVSGPTGSGKSTTLKIILEELYRERKEQVNILTIEDPPEYEIRGAAQLPVTNVDNEEERGAAYRQAITAALRSDPDVIMPGEARDREVINLVFTAAMTGHQVWTSLHANSALAIFDRLRDQGVESYKLTNPQLLTGLTAQRLVKRLCPHCSQPPSADDLSHLAAQLECFAEVSEGFTHGVRLNHPDGCKHCTAGYSGRTVLAEVICPDQQFLNLMDRGERDAARRHWAEELGGLSMMEHGWLLMVVGQVDPRDLVDRMGPFSGMDATRRAALINLK